MSDMTYIGIDPGLDGAIAIVWAISGGVKIIDMPAAKVGKHRHVDASMLAHLWPRTLIRDGNVRVAIEKVHSMPKQGVASSFSFGEGYGIVQGFIAAQGYSVDLVTPQRWKKALMDGMQKEKEAALYRARQLYPEAASELARKKDIGRADALLIAEYLRRTDNGS